MRGRHLKGKGEKLVWLAFEGEERGSVRGRRLKRVGVTCMVSA